MWKLRPGWSATLVQGELIVQSDTRRFRISGANSLPAGIADEINGGCAMSDATQSLFAQLAEHGIAMPAGAHQEGLRAEPSVSPQALYFSHVGVVGFEGVRRVRSCRVLVLGLGGVGSMVLQHLSGAGIESWILVDHDDVAASNLERQFIYSAQQIGTAKVLAAKEYLVARNPAARIHTHCQRIAAPGDLGAILTEGDDIALCLICIDEPPTAIHSTAQFLWNSGIPCIYGGVMIRSGFFGPVFDRLRGSPSPSSFVSAGPAGQLPPIPLQIGFSPYNAVISSLIAAESLHYLVGAFDLVDFHHRTVVDLSRGRFLKLAADCGGWDRNARAPT